MKIQCEKIIAQIFAESPPIPQPKPPTPPDSDEGNIKNSDDGR
jgi:hypothetical protein